MAAALERTDQDDADGLVVLPRTAHALVALETAVLRVAQVDAAVVAAALRVAQLLAAEVAAGARTDQLEEALEVTLVVLDAAGR